MLSKALPLSFRLVYKACGIAFVKERLSFCDILTFSYGNGIYTSQTFLVQFRVQKCIEGQKRLEGSTGVCQAEQGRRHEGCGLDKAVSVSTSAELMWVSFCLPR